ncbi:hypothetical protein [Amycolatopsis sp. NPDC051061]|uniref:hypothetical protein n=1 Tax=Amycolatopsis sp. NPDC051061 TaxID=3155042 RepID=UPI003421F490
MGKWGSIANEGAQYFDGDILKRIVFSGKVLQGGYSAEPGSCAIAAKLVHGPRECLSLLNLSGGFKTFEAGPSAQFQLRPVCCHLVPVDAELSCCQDYPDQQDYSTKCLNQ